MKEEIRVAVIAAALLAAGLLSWMAEELTDCRDETGFTYNAAFLLISGCIKQNPNQIARPFPVPRGIITSRIANQQ